jgi:hypothetical protein
MKAAIHHRIPAPPGGARPVADRATGEWHALSATIAGTCGRAAAALEFLAGRGMKSARAWFTQR